MDWIIVSIYKAQLQGIYFKCQVRKNVDHITFIINQGHESKDSSGAGSSFNLHYRLEFSFGGKAWTLTIISAKIQHIVNANKWTSTQPVVRCMTLDHYEWLQLFHHYWTSFEFIIWRSFPRIDPCIRATLMCLNPKSSSL